MRERLWRLVRFGISSAVGIQWSPVANTTIKKKKKGKVYICMRPEVSQPS